MADQTVNASTNPIIDDRLRGFPPGHPPIALAAIGEQGWKPHDGTMALPLMSIDEAAFAGNVRAMFGYVRGQGIEIAPHAKTPMSTAIARALISSGAWGTTVADIRQTSVFLKAGLSRLVIANETGGLAAARRLAAAVAAFPAAELHIFVDSIDAVDALRQAWSERDDLPALGLLIEFGAGRAGARTIETGTALLDAILSAESGTFRLTGIAAYEGAAATPDPNETIDRINSLMALTAQFLRSARARLNDRRRLIVTAGGSVYFDMVVNWLGKAVANDENSLLVLRSGAIFFHDHGVYERGLKNLDTRRGFIVDGSVRSASSEFVPALRLWAEILSRPEPGLAIAGMGMRDVANDQDLPRPLWLYRDGQRISDLAGTTVLRLNDQHAFVKLSEQAELRVGDVVEFGVSHPCTCLDRHAILYGLDADHRVTKAYLTSFG